MKKMSKLARKLQESKRSNRRTLKENYSPKVAKVNDELKKFINKDTTFVTNSIQELGGGFTKGVSMYVDPKDDVNDSLMDGTNVHVHESDGTFYDQPAGTWVIGVESPTDQISEFVSEAEAKEFFGIISPLLKNAGAKLIVNDEDTDRPFTELFDEGEVMIEESDMDLTDDEYDEKYPESEREEYFMDTDDDLNEEGTPDLDALLTEESNETKYVAYAVWDEDGKEEWDIISDNKKGLSREDARHIMKTHRQQKEKGDTNTRFSVMTVADYNSRLKEDGYDESDMITEGKKSRGRFKSKRKAIRGKRKLNESKKKDIHFGMNQNLFESINSFLVEGEEDEEEFFSNPDQEDAFGKSGRDDNPRSGKEFQKKMSAGKAYSKLVDAAKEALQNPDSVTPTKKLVSLVRSFVNDELKDEDSTLIKQFAPYSVNIDDSEQLMDVIVRWFTDNSDFFIEALLPTSLEVEDMTVEDIVKIIKKIESGDFSSIYDITGNLVVAALEHISETEELERMFPELKQMNIDVQTPPQDRPTNNPETSKFLKATQRFEEVLARMNGIGVNSDGGLDVDLSDHNSEFSWLLETASDSLSDLLEYLDR